MHRTPRTLSECRFTCGYPYAIPTKRERVWPYVVIVLTCFAAIGAMLAS